MLTNDNLHESLLSVEQQKIEQILSSFQFTATQQQREATDKLWQFLQGIETFFLLAGYAGTGKSTIVFAIIKQLLSEGKRVVLTAPTNKAVNVLKKIAVQNNVSIPCLTIHQLLGLALVNRNSEKVLERNNPSSIRLYDCIFLDECSMVNQQLWQCICEDFNNLLLQGRKLIMMGDPAQLNPVGEKRSPTFSVQNRYLLREIVRQDDSSPVYRFVKKTRVSIASKKKVFKPIPYFQDDSNGAFAVSRHELIEYAINKIEKQFKTNPDCFRILCYTNKQVSYYNQQIRQAIYGSSTDIFAIGERLISKKPIIAPDGVMVIIPTSSEFEVKEVGQTTYYGYLTLSLTVQADTGERKQIYVLHPQDMKRYFTELSNKEKKAKSNLYYWRDYFKFRDDIFATVENCYCLTVHSSQGSTFDECGIDGRDISKRLFVGEESFSRKLKEYHRLWYVAASRVRKKILFYQP
jgi:exodeoxyribonuclease-5